jgi:hypothetical protein
MSIRNIDYHNVRYTQETFYPYFSNGKMSVSETYVALANGFLDPASLASITIFEHNKHLYCIDTRRLTILKELQRKKKLDVLKGFDVQYVKEGDKAFTEQYFNLVYERLPTMKSKGLDGSTIKLYRESAYMCCFDSISGNFRDDLDEHVAHDHLKMSFAEFKKLNVGQCNRCHQKFHLTVFKPSNKSTYKVMHHCACRKYGSTVLDTIEKPWPQVTLQEICETILSWNSYCAHTLRKTSVCSLQLKKSSDTFTLPFTRKPYHKGEFCLFLLGLLFIVILSCSLFK